MKITSIKAKNFLSFGDEEVILDNLGDVILLVGPNGTGKSCAFRALEFAGRALAGHAPWAGDFVHNQQVSRRIEIDVGVRLHEEEARLATQLIAWAASPEGRIHDSLLKPKGFDQRAAEKAVASVLSRATRLFKPIFESEVHFLVSTFPGYGQEVRSAIVLGDVARRFTVSPIHGFSRLSREPFESGSHSNVMLTQKAFDEIASVFPTALHKGPAGGVIPDAEMERILERLSPEWLYNALESKEGYPMAVSLENIPLTSDGDRGRELQRSEPMMNLISFLLRHGYPDLNSLTVVRFLAFLFNSSIYSLSELRTKISVGEAQVTRGGSDGPIIVTGHDLPGRLFELKNSPQPEDRARFAELRETFRQLADQTFDVVQVRSVPTTKEKPDGSVLETQEIVFQTRKLEFRLAHSAAGAHELLLILYMIYGPSNSVILLDEPATNLHPSKQRLLFRDILGTVKAGGNQVFLITHSTSFVDAHHLEQAFRIDAPDGVTVTRRLDCKTDQEKRDLAKLIQLDPTVLGALFSRRVIVLEGYDERAVLPVWFAKCNGTADLEGEGVLFLNATGDKNLKRYGRVLESWGIPYRLVADAKAEESLKSEGERALVFPHGDLAELIEQEFPRELNEARKDWHGGLKDPAVLRAVALATAPPTIIHALWDRLSPFVGGTDQSAVQS